MRKLDLYIIKKFLGTFFYAISLLAIIIIVFDISEKIDVIHIHIRDFLYFKNGIQHRNHCYFE